jgi:hypothetical protein
MFVRILDLKTLYKDKKNYLSILKNKIYGHISSFQFKKMDR